MNKTKKAFAVGIAAVLACGTLAGCDALTTTDSVKDYAQVIAEVDITKSDRFGEEFGEAQKGFITKAVITKQEMAASFISNYSYLAQYGYDVADIFDMIADSLATRQMRVQYSVAYLAKKYSDSEENKTDYADGDLTAYQSYMNADRPEEAAAAASLAFFLTDDEEAKAKYDVRVALNQSIDSAETNYIKATEEGDYTPDSEVRTRPTGADTEDEDYFTTDAHYRVYTGLASQLKDNEYEPQEGSTPSTRKKAYNRFIASLRANSLLGANESTAEIENTSYFYLQLKSQYETIILDKVNDLLEEEGAAKLTKEFAERTFSETLAAQKEKFEDESAFETDLNNMSDTALILTPNDGNYGFVINILLPFSATQSQDLTDASGDRNDKDGNKYTTRQKLLEQVVATDQRGTWFTGKDDFSYEATDGFPGGDGTRNRLFFEDNFPKEGEPTDGLQKYETLKNYYGKYTYNGTVAEDDDGKYVLTPNRINIDEFLGEMADYLEFAKYGGDKQLKVDFDGYAPEVGNADFYTVADFTYGAEATDEHKATDVNYAKFVYASGKVSAADGSPFDPNEMFVADTWENTAFSVINELSFAYNTDTAGLNTYLGYVISPYKTSFVPEFEYAAQEVVKKGAGNFIVVPSDYGWHVIYCTFSFADMKDNDFTFSFNYDERKGGSQERENSFSYLYFEALKAQAVESYLSERQTAIQNDYYEASKTIYEDAFKDLKNLG